MREKLKGYKTLIFNTLMGGLLMWKMIKPDAPVPEDAATLVTSVLDNLEEIITIVGNIILRFRTNTAVGKSV